MRDIYLNVLQAVADNKKTVGDEDIIALMGDEASQTENAWDLLDLQVMVVCPAGSHLWAERQLPQLPGATVLMKCSISR